MNRKPTPETNELVKTQLARVGMTPSVLAAKLTIKCESLERERDEAREEIKMLKTNLEISLRQTEQAVQDRADEHQTLTEQRDRLAEEVGQLKSRLTQTMGAVTISRNGYVQEMEQQRDRLAEVLQRIRDGYGGQVASANCCADCDYLSPIDEALQSLTLKP
jgi:chromosome segregation ATPase